MKRMTLALLLLALLMTVFAACKDGGGNADETTGNSPATDSGAENVGDDLPADLRFDGEEFMFCTYEGGNVGQGWACFFDVDEPEGGNILEEASYNRNVEVEERLGVKVSCTELWPWDGTSNGLVKVVSLCSMAGKNQYDTFFIEDRQYEVFVIDELVMDVRSMPHMDLSKPYYAQEAHEAYDIGGHLYFFISDITYACQSASFWIVNNDMLVDLGYEEDHIYNMVNDGTWTFDAAFAMTDGLYEDLNGNGEADLGDKFGFSSIEYGLTPLWSATGLRGTILTESGFEFDYGSDFSFEVLERILEFAEDPDVYVKEWSHEPFENGRSLFDMWSHELRALKSLSFDFGILPFPKYNESQDRYYNTVTGGPMLIPANIENEELVGAVLEAMSSGSAKHFVPAFYDNYIEQGVIRDDESRANWAKLLGEWGDFELTSYVTPDGNLRTRGPIVDAIAKLDHNFASTWASQKDRYAEFCQEFFDWYLADQ